VFAFLPHHSGAGQSYHHGFRRLLHQGVGEQRIAFIAHANDGGSRVVRVKAASHCPVIRPQYIALHIEYQNFPAMTLRLNFAI
jgi:hypothetical protein